MNENKFKKMNKCLLKQLIKKLEILNKVPKIPFFQFGDKSL